MIDVKQSVILPQFCPPAQCITKFFFESTHIRQQKHDLSCLFSGFRNPVSGPGPTTAAPAGWRSRPPEATAREIERQRALQN